MNATMEIEQEAGHEDVAQFRQFVLGPADLLDGLALEITAVDRQL